MSSENCAIPAVLARLIRFKPLTLRAHDPQRLPSPLQRNLPAYFTRLWPSRGSFAAPVPVRTCRICALDTPEVDIPTDNVTPRCEGTREICVNCLERHIQEEVTGKCRSDNIHCICSAACSVLLLHADVQKHATAAVFRAFDTRLFRVAIEKDPEFCWCARPGCGSGQLHALQNIAPIMTCHVCGFATCFKHRCAYHDSLQHLGRIFRDDGKASTAVPYNATYARWSIMCAIFSEYHVSASTVFGEMYSVAFHCSVADCEACWDAISCTCGMTHACVATRTRLLQSENSHISSFPFLLLSR
jgi:hypothetical protein